jgi:hypothetical protein
MDPAAQQLFFYALKAAGPRSQINCHSSLLALRTAKLPSKGFYGLFMLPG